MRGIRAFSWGVVALATAVSSGLGSPPTDAIRAVRQAREARSVAFEVHAPAVEVSGAASSAKVRLTGFDAPQRRSGAPDLPQTTVLVAIPPGATPLLEVRAMSERLLPGIRPAPLARLETGAPAAIEDASLYHGTETYPRSIAWLGDEGVMRDQRYVAVHLAPVRYDPSLPGLRVEESYEVTVRFEGDSGTRAEAPRERLYEEVYRKAFVNYAQGTTFRMSATMPASKAAPEAAPSLLVGPLYRLTTRQNAVLRLDHARMAATPFITENLATWKLVSRGVEVPLHVQDDGDGVLEPGEWVQLYGQKLDNEPNAVLNHDFPEPEYADLWEARDFSDENVYFLSVDGSSARARMASLDAAPTNIRIPPADFEAVAHAETDNVFRPLFDADAWVWSPGLCLNCPGSQPVTRTDTVPLPGLSSGTLPVQAAVELHGVYDAIGFSPDHKTRVTLQDASGQTIATSNDDGSFDGREVYTHAIAVTPSPVTPATNPVKIAVDLLPSGARNEVYLDSIEIRYRRTFTAMGDLLTFDWPDEDAEFVVGGLTSASPALYELTGQVGFSGIGSPVRLTGATVSGAGPWSVRFRVDDAGLPSGTLRRFVVVADPGVSLPDPADLGPDTVSTLRSTSNQADLIVIVHPGVVDLAEDAPLDELLERRGAQGVSSIVATMQDVQDEFNDGLSGPLAISNLLKWVMSTNPGEGWAAPKPSYVLLIGDASYDYKGGGPTGSYVPTQMFFKDSSGITHYASDSVLATVVGNDRMPDLVVGRLSARSVAESDLLIQKVLDYEQNVLPGNWRRHALVISDRGTNADPGGDAPSFELINAEALGAMPAAYSSQNLRYWSDFCGAIQCDYPADADAIRDQIKASVNGPDAFSGGAGVVQYVGHGNFDWWSNDAFFDDFDPEPPNVADRDTSDLANGLKLPWLLVHTCLTGGFHSTADHTMGEDWMSRPGGGAIAVFAPSGLGHDYIGREVTNVIWPDLFGRTKERSLAVPVLDSLVFLCTQGYHEPCQYYTLQGDPSLTLGLRSVAPPTAVQAVAGNARVDLSWTASTTPGVEYSVWRSVPPNPAYVAVGTDLTTTSFADTSVQNARTYLYYVTAFDAENFESRWSNFNSDCAVSGPDCVRAIPLNPNPPSTPATPTVTNTERGGQLRIDWTPHPEGNEIQYYTVHYGIEEDDYTVHLNAGVATSFAIVGLENGRRYYVALTATNTSGHTSDHSVEASGIPTALSGIRPPAFIGTLRLNRSGVDDILLTWPAVTTDVYGGPESVGFYEVYRGTTPDFLPSAANRVGTPATASFTDPHAMAAAARYYYVVRAVDVDGNGGGLGNEIPNGVFPLAVNRATSPAGDLVLSWPAVTTKIGGATAQIDHYNVYTSNQTFTRAQMSGMTPIALPQGTTVQVTPSNARQYYSVLAVDKKGNVSPF